MNWKKLLTDTAEKFGLKKIPAIPPQLPVPDAATREVSAATDTTPPREAAQPAKRGRGRPKKLPGILAVSEKDQFPAIIPDNQTHKMNNAMRIKVMQMIAEFISVKEIVHVLKDEHGLTISENAIRMYQKNRKWKAIIQEFRREHLLRVEEVPGSHKRVRLERADKVYAKAIDKGDLKAAIQANEHARREMEEKGQAITLNLNQFNLMSDAELLEKRKELLDEIKKKEAIDVKPTSPKT